MLNRFVALFFLILLAACAAIEDKQEIIVSGIITDSKTGKPIANAEVLVLCWYMLNIEEATFEKKTLRTDSNGSYRTTFKKGHQVDIASKAIQYQPNRLYTKLSNNKITANLKLSKSQENPSLQVLLNWEEEVRNETQDNSFLRIRIQGNNNGKELNLGDIKTYGFDMKTLRITPYSSHADVWFKIEKKAKQPSTILSNKNGGLIPIFRNEINNSLFYEKSIAPTSGYKTSHKLHGNEEGFFILSRDNKTYGKIILDKSETEVNSPDGKGGHFIEFGKNFSCLYQPNGTTNLSYPIVDIDLEDFLVGGILK